MNRPAAHRLARLGARAAAPARWAQCGRRLLHGAALLASLLPAAGGHATEADEASLKAAFALNFAKFTEWPAGRLPRAGGAFTLCQLGGADGLSRALGALVGKSVQGFPIAFRRIDSIDQVRDCMLLFAGDKPPQALPGAAVLTVGDGPGFALQGGMIGFVRNGPRLRFEINLDAIHRSGLTISSQVLSLAANVIEGNRQQPHLPPLFQPALASRETGTLQPAQSPPREDQ